MKTSSVSTAALSNALRYAQARMQSDLVKASKEAATGKVADFSKIAG